MIEQRILISAEEITAELITVAKSWLRSFDYSLFDCYRDLQGLVCLL